MQRDKSLYKLSHDHHHGLKLAELIKDGAHRFNNLPSTIEGKVKYTLDFYKEHLVNHFKEEEDILFPFVKNKSKELDILFIEIIEEHKVMRRLIEDLTNAANNSSRETILSSLGNLLKQHIRKEERELFTFVEDILSESELEELGKLISGKEAAGN